MHIRTHTQSSWLTCRRLVCGRDGALEAGSLVSGEEGLQRTTCNAAHHAGWMDGWMRQHDRYQTDRKTGRETGVVEQVARQCLSLSVCRCRQHLGTYLWTL